LNPDFKLHLLEITQASDCQETEVIQSLWSGYGKISRYLLLNSSLKTVIIKHIAPEQPGSHPRGWNSNHSHQRKVKSYQVETHWYQRWNQQCSARSRGPKFIGAYSSQSDQWIVLEDLNPNFPLRKYDLSLPEVKVCLSWLANFHATFINQSPSGLWPIGTYWHLDTRPDEFEKIEHQALKAKAHLIDKALNECKYKTIVHGDAKLANFCFSANGEHVAAVDFQYVGGGCGMKDVAYFLGSCLSSPECKRLERELLDYYFIECKNALVHSSSEINFNELEDEWRAMYPYACTDFVRFLVGWMPTHQKINAYNLRMVNEVLGEL